MKKNTILLIFLVIVFIVLACSSLVGKSLVCDESAHHIPVGYVFLKTGDFSFATDSPVLARYLAGFPLLFMDVKLPMERSYWARDDRAEFSREFLYKLNRDLAGKITVFARLPMVLVGALGGIFLFLWTRKRFDATVAAIASLFYFLSPNILAHTRLATTDITSTVTIMCSVFTFWDFLTYRTLWRALAAGIFLGLALMAKYSALLLLPAYLLILIVWVMYQAIVVRNRKYGLSILKFFLILIIAFGVLWAGYAFEELGPRSVFWVAGGLILVALAFAAVLLGQQIPTLRSKGRAGAGN